MTASKYTWKSRDGRIHVIKDMEDRHLLNTIFMLERMKNAIWFREHRELYSFMGCLQGEMAIDSAERSIREHEATDPYESLCRETNYWVMLCIAKKRGLISEEAWITAREIRSPDYSKEIPF